VEKAWIALRVSRVSRAYVQKLAADNGMSLDEFMRQMIRERLHSAGIAVEV
jgi:hypothetical protein